ncbi:MAG: hypothetical protein V1745_01620 [Patescibacteria group bacterium]
MISKTPRAKKEKIVSVARKGKPPVAAMVAVAVVVLVAGGVALAKSQGWILRPAAPARPAPVLSADEISTLVQKIGTQLPIKADEDPTVATIKDVDTLRQQNPEFYGGAKNGDRLLVWSDTAVLYSTEQQKILNVLTIQPPTSTQPTTPQAAQDEKNPVVGEDDVR